MPAKPIRSKSGGLIEARDLSVSYGSESIWSKASFVVNKGEFVAILGPNGAGKTTLFRLLLGLMQPAGGELRLFGESPRRGHERIGYLPQRHLVDSDKNIEAAELVRLGLNGNKIGYLSLKQRQKVEASLDRALKQVDAKSLAQKPLGTLSGGELQRIFLAQALISQPKLLMLDEPFANLDIRREFELAGLISDIAKKNKVGVLLITHDFNSLLTFLDKVIYVANGQVVSGKPDEIITSKVLSKLYGSPVEVLRDSKGRMAVLGTQEAIHHE